MYIIFVTHKGGDSIEPKQDTIESRLEREPASKECSRVMINTSWRCRHVGRRVSETLLIWSHCRLAFFCS